MGGKASREYHRAYQIGYLERPGVRERRAEQARKRIQDPAQRHKHQARWRARSAIASGKLIRQPCEVCGETKVEAHHDDYFRPLDVRWLCRTHHKEHHSKANDGQPI